MDITTVNDRHLYQANVTVRNPEDPSAPLEMARRIVRFGPSGWLTVVQGLADVDEIELFPISRVLAVSQLRELDPSMRRPAE